MPTRSTPALGLPVIAIDGAPVGTVVEVRENAFRMRLGQHFVWMAMHSVWTVDRSAVTLICDRSGVRNYQLLPATSVP